MKLENKLQATREVVNYSHYTSNETIEIGKYLSENKTSIINLLANAIGGNTNLLIAPTGSGKSYTVINILKQFNTKALFILPNSANVKQTMAEYSIGGAYADLSPIVALENNNIVAMTWDKTEKLKDFDLSEYIVVIDEIHQTFTDNYRSKAIRNLYEITKKCKGRIDITATPNKLDFIIYDYIVQYNQKEQTKYNVKLYNNVDTSKIIEILNNSNSGALLFNNIKELKYISSKLNKKNDIVESNTKEQSKLYDHIMYDSNMGDYKALLNTTTIVAGVNIYNPNITDIVIVGIKDIGTIKQYVARFRDLKEVNVHIFNTYKEECNTFDIEWLVNKYIEESESVANACNKLLGIDSEFQVLGLDNMPIKLDSNIRFNADTNKYEVDSAYIRSQTYFKYYNNRTIEAFETLLGEYFEHTEIVEITINEAIEEDKQEFIEDLKLSKEEAIEELGKHKNILVGYEEINKDKRSYKLMEYHQQMQLEMEYCQKEYLKNNIHKLIKDNSLKNMINLYSKNVLEYGYSTNVAWTLANMNATKRSKIIWKLTYLALRELQEEYPNAFKDTRTLEIRLFELLQSEFPIGTSYTKEHIEILAETFRLMFGNVWSINEKFILDTLNQIYNIDSKQYKKGGKVPLANTIFYRNMVPTSGTFDKKTNVYTIKSESTLKDIKQELNINDNDKSLEVYISSRKSRLLDSLNDIEQEILLKNIF